MSWWLEGPRNLPSLPTAKSGSGTHKSFVMQCKLLATPQESFCKNLLGNVNPPSSHHDKNRTQLKIDEKVCALDQLKCYLI